MMTEARREALRLACADKDLRLPHQVVERAQVYLEFLQPSAPAVVEAASEPEPMTLDRATGVLGVLAEHHSWLMPDEIQALQMAVAHLRAGA